MAENFHQDDDWVVAHVTSLSDSSDFDITTADWSVGKVSIHTYVVGGSCDIKMLIDSGGDFSSPETNITLDSFGGSGISEGNATPLRPGRAALRVTNTSGSAADFAVFGRVQHRGDR